MKTISLIVPCYNEEPTVNLFYDTTEKVFEQLNQTRSEQYKPDYIFINDGSVDKTLDVMRDLHNEHPDEVHYISFSRNFGKESAFAAGLSNAHGDFVAVMDVDLQDPPELLLQMVDILEQPDTEYDVVGCIQKSRHQNPVRAFLSSSFYKVINKMSKVPIKANVRDYRLMTRKYVDAVLEMPEYNRFSKGLFSWVGFKTKYLEYEGVPRAAGTTSWSLSQLFDYSLEALVDFSDVPLKLATFVGGLICFLSIIGVIFVVIRAIFFGGSVNGWASIVSIILFLSGVQLFCLGIVGKYISKIYLETKHRPKFIIQESR
ncbi:glycosyltransferase family 2 protein [Lentilactobacillus sp. SPB1-3]|uniref:Glycosyltransferase family 2 protein n=1 Tax=Lentilactobacillus terminaliae TaxID=3003483 RepID=A0ACD5DGQ1_9LACO|nr:glycosyltransferase family 2 protein [Lentilactobacillus sp. SPB1-3]MCZ0976834.1 glycosyltransferase family 2 protein [Lentilactobacillus sp. SPB1-3]